MKILISDWINRLCDSVVGVDVLPHEFYIAAKEGEASATGHGVDFYIAAKEQGKRVVRHGVKF